MKERWAPIIGFSVVAVSIATTFALNVIKIKLADRTCSPFASVAHFDVSGKLHTVCRDLDGGLQLREAP